MQLEHRGSQTSTVKSNLESNTCNQKIKHPGPSKIRITLLYPKTLLLSSTVRVLLFFTLTHTDTHLHTPYSSSSSEEGRQPKTHTPPPAHPLLTSAGVIFCLGKKERPKTTLLQPIAGDVENTPDQLEVRFVKSRASRSKSVICGAVSNVCTVGSCRRVHRNARVVFGKKCDF